MNERLLDFLRRSEVSRLPEEKRKLYEFITGAEDALAEKAATADEFFSLVLTESPINLAMNHFQLPYDQVVSLLTDIEEELHVKIKLRSEKVKWIDFSEKHYPSTGVERKNHLFLFINE
ncbi:MAG TPA: hypothetical protein VLQ20_07080 [Planococcus sp. (in: firmicutes)]|nr:hypothetical protein [Planococcus sp. (in: firmicutes)]